jgi:hypothetical protein
MNSKLLLAGIVIVVLVAIGSLQLANITGYAASSAGNFGVTVNIENGAGTATYKTTVTPRETAFDALKRVATVDYRIYSTGVLITAINGLTQDSGHYWMYFVNGNMPEVGCDYYHPNDGDVITFRYLTTEEAAEYFK